jgi:tRNA(Ile)-lysidine synthase
VQVTAAVNRFLKRLPHNQEPIRIIVAFSGGPDSTALLHSLAGLQSSHRIKVIAAHLDHSIDGGSEERARFAHRLANQLHLPFETSRESAPDERRPGESLESAARRIRYTFLQRLAGVHEAVYIATAHHQGDQAETVLLRMLYGSALAGLAGIPARREAIVRPLLEVSREDIESYLEEHRLDTVSDPTNFTLETPRNVVRHLLLPSLRAKDPRIDARLLSLAESARCAVAVADRRLETFLNPTSHCEEISCQRQVLEMLPPDLRIFAIGSLARKLGASPPTRSALTDLSRQLESGQGVGCDLGAGWHLEDRGGTLVLGRRQAPTAPFAYTLTVPGEIRLPELSLIFRLRRQRVEPWMFRGSRRRVGMVLPLEPGDQVTIRSRRPGDRIQPFGCSYSRRLKEVLIDLKMARRDRDLLPLLTMNENVVWVPGVTIDHRVRLEKGESEAWVAEILHSQETVE